MTTDRPRFHLVQPEDRVIPEPAAGRCDPVAWRAAVYLESAAALVRRWGELRKTCSPMGERRYCGRCVHCYLAEARADYKTDCPHMADADLDESMAKAFQAAEAEHLHLRPPGVPKLVTDLLMATAMDMYRNSVPPNTQSQIARTGSASRPRRTELV